MQKRWLVSQDFWYSNFVTLTNEEMLVITTILLLCCFSFCECYQCDYFVCNTPNCPFYLGCLWVMSVWRMVLISCMRPHLEQRKVLQFPDCGQVVLQLKTFWRNKDSVFYFKMTCSWWGKDRSSDSFKFFLWEYAGIEIYVAIRIRYRYSM